MHADPSILHQLEADKHDRLMRFKQAWEYYKGQHAEPVKTPQDRVVVNNAGTIVDIGVDFLFGTTAGGRVLEFHAADEDEQDQQRVDALWKANGKNTLLRLLSLNGGVTGHPWLRIRPPARPGEPARIINVDPATVSVGWDPADYTVERIIRVEWLTQTAQGVEAWREDHVQDENEQGWTIHTSRTRVPKIHTALSTQLLAASWNPVGEPERWPYPWAQLQGAQNLPRPNEYWGSSDIEADMQGLNDAINRVASDTRKTIRHYAHPKTILKGAGVDDIDTSIGNLIGLPEGAEMSNLEMQSELRSSFAMLEWLDAKQWERSSIPKIAAGRAENMGHMSSLALEIMYRPLVAKTNTKRDLYGDLLRDVTMHALELSRTPVEDVTLYWPDVLPRNEREAVETSAMLVERVGGSRRTQLESLGLDADVELERRREEETMGLGVDVGLAGLLADLEDGAASGDAGSVEDA